MAKRPLPEINSGSMADIAFLLLIFFLVTTTMDTNTGMTRKLPAPQKEKVVIDVNERNVLVVLINKHNQLAVESRLVTLERLHEKVKEFFTNPLRDKNLPEIRIRNIPLLGGDVEVSKGVVSLQNDRGTKYERYIAVQNQILKAINDLRDEKSVREFGAKFDDLSEDKKDAIKKFYPYSISEAEPMEIK